jgi:hypothetical protein
MLTAASQVEFGSSSQPLGILATAGPTPPLWSCRVVDRELRHQGIESAGSDTRRFVAIVHRNLV